jgi:eukaryotic-like serine/threonine-protein kinase
MSLVGRVFSNRYEILRPIAQGGMAEVFVAHDRLLDRQVALKALFPEYAREPSFVERFRREAQSAAGLSHANIVAIYDWGQEAGTYFIVMELVQGRSLRDLIRAEGPLDAHQAAEIAAEIAAALAYAHRSGLVHRDVKPGNVLITPTGGVKVTDFGIARAGTSEALTQTGSVMGTATYFSPEQAQGHSVDGRSDVYSLGVVLYEMVTGIAPFTGDTPVAVAYKHVREAPVPPSRRNPDVPGDLEQVILTAMQKEPEARYQTAEDLRADLLRFRRGRPLAAAPVTAMVAEIPTGTAAVDPGATMVNPRVAEIAPARSGSSRAIAAVLTILVLALIVGLVFVLADNNKEPGNKTLAVPNVVGKQLEAATNQLENLGFEVEAVPRPNEEKPIGEVTSQDPKAKSEAREGDTITLFYSSAEVKTVPDVTGLTAEEAKQLLADNGFTNVAATPIIEASDTVGALRVIRTEPTGEQDTSVVITLVVSSGPTTKPVPNVLNFDVNEASETVRAAGFTVATIEAPSEDVAVGRVISTDPGPNEEAPVGSTVTITYSSGPENKIVPNVVGRTEASAIDRLEADGFVVDVSTQSSTEANDGRVIAQTPAGNETATPGSTVAITVGVFTPEPTTSTSTTTTVAGP